MAKLKSGAKVQKPSTPSSSAGTPQAYFSNSRTPVHPNLQIKLKSQASAPKN